MEFTAKQIADMIGGRVEGDEQAKINTFAKIEEGKKGAISFLSNPKYTPYIYETQSSVVLINEDVELTQPVSCTLIRVKNAYESVAKLLQLYASMMPKKTGIDPLAFVSKSAQIGENVYIAPFAYIGDGVKIGDGSRIYPHVTIYDGCQIGKNANTCVDRSTMGQTVIHKGVKLDNLIQVAHNCEIGENTVMSAQVGLAGSTKIGSWCMVGGQAGFSGHIHVADKTFIGAQSGVISNTKGNGEQLIGSPAIDPKLFFKAAAVTKRLPDMYKELAALRKEIEELKKTK